MPHNNVRIFALATAICLTATASSANSSLFGDDLKNDEAVVLQLQTQLNELGFDAGPADGAWGRRTAGAIDAFVDRFPPMFPASNANDITGRLQLIHDSWFASPFENEELLVRPPGELFTNQVYKTDIRDLNLSCTDCSLVSFISGLGDFDNDGIDEIVLAEHILNQERQAVESPTPTIIVDLENDRGPSNLVIINAPDGIARVHERESVVRDFNGDGVDDLFIAAHGLDTQPFPGEQNVLLLSSPEGVVDASLTHIPQINDMSHGASAGDIDNDGDFDIIVMTHPGTGRYDSYVLWNDGSGSFSRELLRDVIDEPELVRLYDGDLVINSYSTVRLADLNNDTLPDLLLLSCCQGGRHTNSRSYVLWNNGDGTFTSVNKVILPTDRWGDQTYTNDAEAVDLDNNGLVDLILTQSTQLDNWHGQFIQVLMQETRGNFIDRTAERLWSQGYELPLDVIAAADKTEMIDLDFDGDLDMVTRGLNPAMRSMSLSHALVQIGINDGTGRFMPLDPRFLADGKPFVFRTPIFGRFGPNAEPMMASTGIHGSYSATSNITRGADLYLHGLR